MLPLDSGPPKIELSTMHGCPLKIETFVPGSSIDGNEASPVLWAGPWFRHWLTKVISVPKVGHFNSVVGMEINL